MWCGLELETCFDIAVTETGTGKAYEFLFCSVKIWILKSIVLIDSIIGEFYIYKWIEKYLK